MKPLEENLIEESDSESNYDFEIKEVTEFPDPNEQSDSDSDDEFTILTALK